MQILSLVLLILAGIVALYVGAELLVMYAARLALALGMAPLVVGLTIIAFSTSTPELVSTLMAELKNHSNMALGTVIGSNIANIGCILGVVTLIKPLEVNKKIKTFETPFTLFTTLLLGVFMMKGEITRWMGFILLAGIGMYVASHFIKNKKSAQLQPRLSVHYTKKNKLWYIFFMSLGVGALVWGAALLVKGAVGVAKLYGISDRVIGLTIMAIGTSLPEFAASLIAAIRKLEDVAIGNILGSNIFNILFILGVVASIRPLYFSSKFLHQDMPFLLALTALLWILMFVQKKIGRVGGLLLLGSYIFYLAVIA